MSAKDSIRKKPQAEEVAGPQSVITIDGRSKGRVFEGVGALSAGASSRFLLDYPEPHRSDVLDYLYKPHFGAHVHHLKVEMGGDVNSTLGSEPSHAVTWEEFVHPKPEFFQRGYEWWFMKEARKRNPDIILEVLQWGAPGWIGAAAGRDWGSPIWSGLSDFYSQDNADFIAAFHKGAKRYHNLDLDYQGIRNEVPYDLEWVKLLRRTLDAQGLAHVKIDAGGQCKPEYHWRIAGEMVADPQLRQAITAINCHTAEDVNYHTPFTARHAGTPLWNGEGHAYGGDWYAAANYARSNRAYPVGQITKTIWWSLITAYPDTWCFDTGLMKAAQPWSGHYELQPPLWITAHTNQFAAPGWSYLDSACRFFGGDGGIREGWSITALRSLTTNDYSIIIETMDAKEPQRVRLLISADLAQDDLAVWRSIFKGELFERQADLPVRNGECVITLLPNAVYSLTTTRGQGKGAPAHPIPESQPFPLPYSLDFDQAPLASPARFFCDHHGTFEVIARPDRRGECLRQSMCSQGNCWGRRTSHPLTTCGDKAWRNYQFSAEIMRPGEAGLKYQRAILLLGRVTKFTGDPIWVGPLDGTVDYASYALQFNENGSWHLTLQPRGVYWLAARTSRSAPNGGRSR
jgi:Glycosyl hydrolase family 59